MWLSRSDIEHLPEKDRPLARAMDAYAEAFRRGAPEDELEAMRRWVRREYRRRWPRRVWPRELHPRRLCPAADNRAAEHFRPVAPSGIIK